MKYRIESFVTVVGSNPEMADMSNPRGDIHREVWYPTVTTPDGRIFVPTMSGYMDKNEAAEYSAFLEEHGADPVTDKGFEFLRNSYGSDAHFFELNKTEVAMTTVQEDIKDLIKRMRIAGEDTHADDLEEILNKLERGLGTYK